MSPGTTPNRLHLPARWARLDDLILDRAEENRSQLVLATARGRDAVFWQSPRTRKQARPNVTTPTARAAGIASLEIMVALRADTANLTAAEVDRCRWPSVVAVRAARSAVVSGCWAVSLDG